MSSRWQDIPAAPFAWVGLGPAKHAEMAVPSSVVRQDRRQAKRAETSTLSVPCRLATSCTGHLAERKGRAKTCLVPKATQRRKAPRVRRTADLFAGIAARQPWQWHLAAQAVGCCATRITSSRLRECGLARQGRGSRLGSPPGRGSDLQHEVLEPCRSGNDSVVHLRVSGSKRRAARVGRPLICGSSAGSSPQRRQSRKVCNDVAARGHLALRSIRRTGRKTCQDFPVWRKLGTPHRPERPGIKRFDGCARGL